MSEAAFEAAFEAYALAETGIVPGAEGLRAASVAYERALWRPIATAPKAGVVVLCYDSDRGVYQAQNDFGAPVPEHMKSGAPPCETWPYDIWHMVYGEGGGFERACECALYDAPPVQVDPTHWRPLPEAPAGE